MRLPLFRTVFIHRLPYITAYFLLTFYLLCMALITLILLPWKKLWDPQMEKNCILSWTIRAKALAPLNPLPISETVAFYADFFYVETYKCFEISKHRHGKFKNVPWKKLFIAEIRNWKRHFLKGTRITWPRGLDHLT